MTWTKPGLTAKHTAVGKWVRVSSVEAFEEIAGVREVQEARLVSWGPCSDPLPHLTLKVEPLRRTP